MTFVIFTLVGFILAYLVRVETDMYKDKTGDLINARGALLEIITTLPFLFIYLSVVYFIIHFYSRITTVIFENNQVRFIGRFKQNHINKNEIIEARFITNNTTINNYRVISVFKQNVFSLNFLEPIFFEELKYFITNGEKTQNIVRGGDSIKEIYKFI